MKLSLTSSQLNDLRQIILKNKKEKILDKFVSFVENLYTDHINEIINNKVEMIIEEKQVQQEIQDAKELAICPKCNCTDKKRAGYKLSKDKQEKKQRYVCKNCGCKYCMDTTEKTSIETKLKAVEYVISKTSKRRTAQIMGVSRTTICQWVRDVYDYLTTNLGITQLVTDEELEKVTNIEIDEMHHKYIKKNENYGFGKSWTEILEK